MALLSGWMTKAALRWIRTMLNGLAPNLPIYGLPSLMIQCLEYPSDASERTPTGGDVLDDYRLRNAAMEHLIDSLPATPQPSPDTAWDVYERTPAGLPLTELLVDQRIGIGDRDEFAVDVEGYPAEFVQELAVSLTSKTSIVTLEEFVAGEEGLILPRDGECPGLKDDARKRSFGQRTPV